MDQARREATLERWMEEYGDAMLRFCFLYLADAALAEDAVQEAFLKAWKRMDTFEGRRGASPKTWLFSIALNTCKDLRRGRWFRHIDLRRALEDIPGAALQAPARDRELLLDIMALPEKQRQVVLLYYYQELRLEEVAQALGIPRSTAHHRLKQARKTLREGVLERRDSDGENAAQTNHR